MNAKPSHPTPALQSAQCGASVNRTATARKIRNVGFLPNRRRFLTDADPAAPSPLPHLRLNETSGLALGVSCNGAIVQYNFEWDPAKARENFRKHKISFEPASQIFLDALAISIPDEEHSEDEERWGTNRQEWWR